MALFELADEQKSLDAVAQDLADLKTMLGESDDLRTVVRSPLLDREQQSQAVSALAEKAEMQQITRNFLGILAHNRRLFALSAIIDQFLDELSRRRGEMTAEVTSAQPLSEEQQKALTDILKQSLGAKVSLKTNVNPSLIGGLIIRVGSKLIDSSVRSKLDRLERAMKNAA